MSEHRLLKAYKSQCAGKRVQHRIHAGVVDGVGDDGARCDYDACRRAKPNGILFVRRDDGILDEVLDVL